MYLELELEITAPAIGIHWFIDVMISSTQLACTEKQTGVWENDFLDECEGTE